MSKQIQVNFNHNQVNQVSQFKWSLKLFKMINKCTPFNLTASSDAIFILSTKCQTTQRGLWDIIGKYQNPTRCRTLRDRMLSKQWNWTSCGIPTTNKAVFFRFRTQLQN